MSAPPNFVHLSRPLPTSGAGPATSSSSSSGTTYTTTPISVTLTPSALFSILDHSVRKPVASSRVIGTLLGSRSDDGSVINVASCYAVPHTETPEQVEVDMDYQKAMLNLHLRANPKEVLVGWYATSGELNTFSALIQNFYGMVGEGTGPAPAVHLTVAATDVETSNGANSNAASLGAGQLQTPEVRAYISAPIGVTPERAADSCLFIPVPCTILSSSPASASISSSYAAERSALSAIALAAANPNDRTAPLSTDIEGLERSIEYILDLIERVSGYVGAVLDEEVEEPSTALGQFMLNALSLAPGTDKTEIERDFNAHIQDVLAISYLANTIRTQIDLSNRLVTAALTNSAGGTSADGGGGGSGGVDGDQQGGKGGRRQGGGDRGGANKRGGAAGGGAGGRRQNQRHDRGGGGGGAGDHHHHHHQQQQQQQQFPSSSSATNNNNNTVEPALSVAFSE